MKRWFIFLNKKTDNQNERYPIELPSRGNKTESSPIVDVVENETFPLEFANCHRGKPHFDTNEDVTEVVATEIESDKAEQTIHGR